MGYTLDVFFFLDNHFICSKFQIWFGNINNINELKKDLNTVANQINTNTNLSQLF